MLRLKQRAPLFGKIERGQNQDGNAGYPQVPVELCVQFMVHSNQPSGTPAQHERMVLDKYCKLIECTVFARILKTIFRVSWVEFEDVIDKQDMVSLQPPNNQDG